MKIIADDNIPYLDETFAEYGELVRVPGRTISAQDVSGADALLIRSITKIDEALVGDSSLKFIGSMTSGEDHVIDSCGINTYVAKGCNANAVAQYVLSCLAALKITSGRVAVIGVGHVGSKVTAYLDALNFDVTVCDPLRENFNSTPFHDCVGMDVVCLHTPLTHDGEYPTYHMLDERFLKNQKPGCVVINAGRGAVIDTALIKKFSDIFWCLDVWENEPNIDLNVLQQVNIATPHIAGYTVESKKRAVGMVFESFISYFNLNSDLVVVESQGVSASGDDLFEKVLSAFDPLLETQRMRAAFAQSNDCFDTLRKTFGDRHEA